MKPDDFIQDLYKAARKYIDEKKEPTTPDDLIQAFIDGALWCNKYLEKPPIAPDDLIQVFIDM